MGQLEIARELMAKAHESIDAKGGVAVELNQLMRAASDNLKKEAD
jgi:hypothetical protein